MKKRLQWAAIFIAMIFAFQACKEDKTPSNQSKINEKVRLLFADYSKCGRSVRIEIENEPRYSAHPPDIYTYWLICLSNSNEEPDTFHLKVLAVYESIIDISMRSMNGISFHSIKDEIISPVHFKRPEDYKVVLKIEAGFRGLKKTNYLNNHWSEVYWGDVKMTGRDFEITCDTAIWYINDSTMVFPGAVNMDIYENGVLKKKLNGSEATFSSNFQEYVFKKIEGIQVVE